jgi:hypothetical protein
MLVKIERKSQKYKKMKERRKVKRANREGKTKLVVRNAERIWK